MVRRGIRTSTGRTSVAPLDERSCLPAGEERARLVREMFDRIAGRYELLNDRYDRRDCTGSGTRRCVNVTADLRPGNGWVLDLACGTGSLTRELAKRRRCTVATFWG